MARRTPHMLSPTRRPRWPLAVLSVAALTVTASACSPQPQYSRQDVAPTSPDLEDEAQDPAHNLLDPEQESIESPSGNGVDGTGWVTQGNADVERTTEVAVDGRSSLKVTGSDSDPVYVDDTRTIRVATVPVPVSEERHYEGTVNVMSPAEVSPVRCELRWYDANGTIVDTALGQEVIGTPGHWQNPTCEATAPHGATSGALRVHVADADVGDVHFVDNAFLVDASSGGSTPSTTTTAAPRSPAPTTTAPKTTTPSTTAPPATTGGSGSAPTAGSVGPRTSNPANVGRVEVHNGEEVTLNDVVASAILVHAGGSVTATNVKVTGSVHVMPVAGAATTKLHLANSSVYKSMTVNTHDSSGNLYWGSNVPVDVEVTDSWLHQYQGSGSDHTEALAGFGWPSGARFTNTAFVQDGPYNNTATATINWHGTNTVFDNCHFLWNSGTAAYYTVYIAGANNVVTNSVFEKGMANYVFPDSSPKATYTANTDATTGKPFNP